MLQPGYSYIFVDHNQQTIEAQISCTFTRRGKWHFARCPEFQMSDQGRTRREALNNLTSMIFQILVVAVEKGKLEEMMKELGFKKTRKPGPEQTRFRQPVERPDRVYPIPLIRVDLRSPLPVTMACAI